VAKFPHKKWHVFTLIAGVGLLIATGGATNEYSQLFLLALTGLLLIIMPVRRLPDGWVLGALGAFLLWLIISTWVPLPFRTAAHWIAEKKPELSAGLGISAQPWLSTEKMGFVFIGMIWLLLAIQYPMEHYRRLKFFQILMWMIGGLALITVICMFLGYQHPLTWGTHRFSFFPNHNQSGAVFALGGILSIGFIIRSMKRREWEMIAYMLVFAVISLALFMGMSRSAVIIMTGGCVLYLLLTLERRNYKFYLKLGLPFILILAAFFILYGGKLLDEFVSVLKTGGVGEEIRVRIWMDASHLAAQFPVFGVGLGNFRYFFPFFIHEASTPQSIYHPESDFLWIWCELGLLGLALVTGVFVGLFRRLNLKELFQNKGSRLLGFIAIGMFLVAGFVEVSGHRLGTALLAVLIYGLIQPEDAGFFRIPGLATFSRLLGIVLISITLFWLQMMVKGEPWLSSEVIRFSQKNLNVIHQKFSDDQIEEYLDRWIKRYPMMRSLHVTKGIYAVEQGNRDRAVEGFDDSHVLNPVWWQPYIHHGLYLYALDFDKALQYWSQGLDMAGDERIEAFDSIRKGIPLNKVPELRDLVYGNRLLQFDYFGSLRYSPVEYSRELGMELAINPELTGFSSEQKQALLWRFCEINGPMMLRRLLERHPILGTENWTVRAQMYANDGDYKEASRLALMNVSEPEMIDLSKTRTLSVIRTEYLVDPDDPLKVIALVQRHLQDGNYKDAMMTIEVARSRNVRHEYLDYQLAIIRFHLSEYEDSWKCWEPIISSSISWEVGN